MNRSQLPDSPLVSSTKLIAQVASAIVFLVGCLVLIGWMLNFPALKSILPNLVTMKANTAFSFLLCGVSLWLHQGKSSRTREEEAKTGEEDVAVSANRRNPALKVRVSASGRRIPRWDHQYISRHLRRRIAQACAFIVVMIGLLTLSEYLFNWATQSPRRVLWLKSSKAKPSRTKFRAVFGAILPG